MGGTCLRGAVRLLHPRCSLDISGRSDTAIGTLSREKCYCDCHKTGSRFCSTGRDRSRRTRQRAGREQQCPAQGRALYSTTKAQRGLQSLQLDELGRISTMPTMLIPLIAIAILPSRVGIMWRTMPPPLGICHVWNFSVLGSNRTRLFGRVFDSTYQILSSITVMP